MSKKKNKSKTEKADSLNIDTSEESNVTQEEELMFSEQVLGIADAASRYIVGFKPHWVPAIKSFAMNMGIDPAQPQTSMLWRSVFVKWGAVLKD